MASFRKRAGAWTATVTRKGFDRLYRTFDTKAEAETWAATVESKMGRGVFVSQKESENTTLKDALDRYEREITPTKKGARQESMKLRIWRRTELAKRSLASIQGKDIAAYRDLRLKEVSPNTVRHELAVLSHVFTIAVKEWGMTSLVNPVRQVRAPKMPRGRNRRPLPGEFDRILTAASGSSVLRDAMILAVETGMRQAEIIGLSWTRVDFERRTVLLIDTKNGEERTVPLSTQASQVLMSRKHLPGCETQVFDVLPHAVSVAFHRALVRARRSYEHECKKTGETPNPAYLMNMTFHDLRHEATSRFFELGFNPMEVSAITGHKTLQMLKRYTHLKAEDLARRLP